MTDFILVTVTVAGISLILYLGDIIGVHREE